MRGREGGRERDFSKRGSESNMHAWMECPGSLNDRLNMQIREFVGVIYEEVIFKHKEVNIFNDLK